MALIKCPECRKDVSEFANQCPNCGYPIQDYVDKIRKEEEEREKRIEAKIKEAYFHGMSWCPACGNPISIYASVCDSCGAKLF